MSDDAQERLDRWAAAIPWSVVVDGPPGRSLEEFADADQLRARVVAARQRSRDEGMLDAFRWAVGSAVREGRPIAPLQPAPDDAAAWVAGGHLLGDAGRLREAAHWFERALVARPGQVQTVALWRWTRWLLGVAPADRDALLALAAEHPDDPLVVGLAGQIR